MKTRGSNCSLYTYNIFPNFIFTFTAKYSYSGHNNKKKEYKFTQFADDTTLILNLNGTQGSLQAALNTLEIFGSMSGLRINKEKTKMVWIGKKKWSKDKLEVSEMLEWGVTQFTLLGIKYSIKLSEMPTINYDDAWVKACKVIYVWKKINISPLGKIKCY